MFELVPLLAASYKQSVKLLLTAESPGLITCDEPVAELPMPGGSGPGGVTLMALDPRHQLLLFTDVPEQGGAANQLDAQGVERHNRMMWHSAYNEIIGGRQHAAILDRFPARERCWAVEFVGAPPPDEQPPPRYRPPSHVPRDP